MPVKVHLALALALRDIGVDTMFGLIGDGDDDLDRASRWPRSTCRCAPRSST